MHAEQQGGCETWELKNEVRKGSTLPRPLSFPMGVGFRETPSPNRDYYTGS